MEELSREAWDAAVIERGGSFLQSWSWGEFQTKVGSTVHRVSDSKGTWVAQWVRQSVHFGAQLACYHGPVPASVNSLQAAVTALGSVGESFLHLELPYGSAPIQPTGWRTAAYRQASATQVLDLSPSLDELREGLHPKTRYNIGLAERNGITVHIHREPEAIREFLKLLPITSKRHHIAAHANSYYESMARMLAPQRMLALFTAERKGKPIAAHVVLQFGRTVTYLHGASDYTERKTMAPHLLQWHQIRWAKEQGATLYDFWGVAPENSGPHHPFAGITRFKLGFGGRTLVSGGAFDLPLKRAWYTLYRAAKRIRG